MSLLPQPKNNRAEVLYVSIVTGKVSIEDFPNLSGFRTRISELHLNHSVKFKNVNKKGLNKFGRNIMYVEHHLDFNEVKNALKVYKTINK